MTANELADWLDKKAIVSLTEYFGEHLELAADMLRKQQAEIKELKTIRGNSVLVPSDKLQAMQAEIEALKKELALLKASDK
jgi:hypothetical protein